MTAHVSISAKKRAFNYFFNAVNAGEEKGRKLHIKVNEPMCEFPKSHDNAIKWVLRFSLGHVRVLRLYKKEPMNHLVWFFNHLSRLIRILCRFFFHSSSQTQVHVGIGKSMYTMCTVPTKRKRNKRKSAQLHIDSLNTAITLSTPSEIRR